MTKNKGSGSLINGNENESGQPNDTEFLEVTEEPVKKQKSRLFGSKKPNIADELITAASESQKKEKSKTKETEDDFRFKNMRYLRNQLI